MAAKNKPNEIYIERIFNAPVKTVWNAWVEPEQVAQWWGPRGFTLTSHSKDVRTGGHWSYTMHGPDGTDYINKTKYLEVENYSRMVYDHGGNDEQAPLFRVTVTFKEVKGKTKMEMIMALATEEAAKETKKFIRKANGDSTWDRLAEYVETGHGKETFVINRTFDTSMKTMFDVWTKPEHFQKWLPPTGATMEILKGEIKEGSEIFWSIQTDSGMKMYGRIHYLEIEPINHLEYTQQFADENGKMSRHPGAPTWPETMLTSVTLTEEEPNRTRVTVIWEPYGKTSTEEIQAFIKERAGMTMGWTGSFDKLEEYLPKVKA